MQSSALCRSRRELSNLQNLASIQPRTSLVKFTCSPRTDPPGGPFEEMIISTFGGACSSDSSATARGRNLPAARSPVGQYVTNPSDLVLVLVLQSHPTGTGGLGSAVPLRRKMSHDFKISLNFEGLVLGCIDADWRDKMYTLVRLHRSGFEISAKNRSRFFAMA